MRGLVCVDDCSRTRFLEELEEPFMPWEIAEDRRIRLRREALMRGEIPA